MSTEAKSSTSTPFENQIDLEKLHLNSKWSDVKFLFDSGDGTVSESISANKAVLAAQSDVFAAMFYGELKEKGDITVTDASFDGFKEFLQFFHLNRVQLTVENVAEVMNLGHKYNVLKCVDACAEFLVGAVNVENACIGLSLALLYDQEALKERCEKFIVLNSEAVFISKSFLDCGRPVVAHILKMDTLFCSETIVFEACMAWIKDKSQQNEVTKQRIQEHLGELFYDFCFTSMKMEEFSKLSTAHIYAFSIHEYKDIMDTLTSMKESSTYFIRNSRQRQWNEGAIIICNRKKAYSHLDWWPLNINKPTQFESNQELLLGTLLFAPLSFYRDSQYVDLESDLPIDVTIVESSNPSISATQSTRVVSNFKINLPSQKETSIKLPTPVRIQPGFNYKIRLNPLQSIENIRYDCGGVAAEVQIENDVTIKFHADSWLYSNKLVNLITGLGFNKI